MRKACRACGVEKDVTEFYTHKRMKDGRLNKCIKCVIERVQRYRKTHRTEVSAYEQRRAAKPARRAYVRRVQVRMRKAHPEKYKARTAVSNALRDGRLTREPCSRCGSGVRVQAHHADYTKPLDVEWLCFRCHREERHGQVVTF